MKSILKFLFVMLLALQANEKVRAQTAYMGLTISTGSTTIELADSLYIGPGFYQLDGTWEFYSSYIIIDPSAIFTGDGAILFQNPGLWTGTSAPTRIDANGITNAIDVNIVQQNDEGLFLTELPFPTDLTTTFGWTENTSSTTLYAGRDVDLAVDGGHIVLGSAGVVGDLVLDADATMSNYGPARYVVTNNSVLSHMVKESFTSAFIFPVGASGTSDYTPAQISNASSNTIHVSVQDYANSASPEALVDGSFNTADGMNRTWHIFADAGSISSTVNLQHNNVTNQTGFSDATHFITQWGTTTPNTTGDNTIAFSMSSWQSNIQGPGALGNLSTTGTVTGSSMRSRTYSSGLATSGAANESYFTKSADSEHPLPISLVSFVSNAQDCGVVLDWEMGEQKDLKEFELMHSVDGWNFSRLAIIEASVSNVKYRYKHNDLKDGLHYYRLRMLEHSGKVRFSPTSVSAVSCPTLDRIVSVAQIYPNPAYDELNITGLGDNVEHTVQLISMDGKVVLRELSNSDRVKLNVSSLASGAYVIQVMEQGMVILNAKFSKL